MLNKIRSEVTTLRPLIHCITNPISINQCANAVLAVGARPIMAEHPREVKEITETANAVMLNIGNITDARMESISISLTTAKQKNIPVILDAVGVACSKLRRDYVSGLFEIAVPTVIKGNYSEINALYSAKYRSSGVDADFSLNNGDIEKAAVSLAQKYRTVILASGKDDIVTDGSRLVHIRNGSEMLAAVTGTGCMLGALCAAYLSVKPDIDAAVAACAVLGICGQLAETSDGNGSFTVNLMNALSTIKNSDIDKYLNMEEKH